jgi:uncharacterized ion transporter superfamily protein YfcC
MLSSGSVQQEGAIMADSSDKTSEPDADLQSRFPTAYTILFLLIVLVAALTWVIPAGQYDRAMNEEIGREVAVPGTFQTVESNPQGPIDVLMAPIAGFYDPDSYAANAIDVALFVLLLGGFLGVVNATGSIDSGMRSAMRSMQGRESWMIPILMGLFAIGGTTYGMAEETLAFYAILLPVVLRAGYDAVTGVAIILIGAGIGVLGSTINPFATIIASDAASIPFTQGMILRFVILIGGLAICIAYVMRYASRVKAENDRSVVARQWDAHKRHFLQGDDGADGDDALTGTQKIILVVFAATFVVMIWGVSSQGWWMARMGALFLGAAIVVGLIGRLGEKRLTGAYIDGARDLLGVALIIGLALERVAVRLDAYRGADESRTVGIRTPAPAGARADRDHRDVGCDIGLRSGPRRSRHTPAARSSRGAPRGSPRLRASRRALPLSRQEILQRGLVEQRLRHQRFSRAFSSSSAFSRFASDTSIPPNLAFQA